MQTHDVLSEIIEGRLYLTSLAVAKNIEIIKYYDIDVIVSIIEYDPFKYNKPKEYKDKTFVHYVAKDEDNFPIDQYFEKFYRLMDENPNKKILVHCLVGISRSATLVLSYLLRIGLENKIV